MRRPWGGTQPAKGLIVVIRERAVGGRADARRDPAKEGHNGGTIQGRVGPPRANHHRNKGNRRRPRVGPQQGGRPVATAPVAGDPGRAARGHQPDPDQEGGPEGPRGRREGGGPRGNHGHGHGHRGPDGHGPQGGHGRPPQGPPEGPGQGPPEGPGGPGGQGQGPAAKAPGRPEGGPGEAGV